MQVVEKVDLDLSKFYIEIKKKFMECDYSYFKVLLQGILTENSFQLPHPISGIDTFCCDSVKIEHANFLFFTDKNNNNSWVGIQIFGFIDAIYVNDFFHLLNPFAKGAQRTLKHFLKSNKSNFTTSKEFGGVIIGHPRPFHFFYDQLINIISLPRDVVVHYDQKYKTFLDLSNLEFDFVCADHDKYFYIEALTVPGFSLLNKKNHLYFLDARKMQSLLKESFNNLKLKSDSTLNIWLGITGQKRSWLEQVNGYVSIIKELVKQLGEITVFIDGWTNYIDDKSTNDEDLYVFELIKQGLKGVSGVELINLICMNYQEKISYSNATDYFIANSGTGCMVPFVFSGTKGVIHGNGKLDVFASYYDNTVRIVPVEKVISEKSELAMNDSYSISWQVLFNLLMEVMGKDKRLEEKEHIAHSKILFSDLKFSEKTQPADALRDIAIAFYKTGDIDTAYKIMLMALEQRPKGPAIKKRVDEWGKLLQKNSESY